MTVNMNDEAFAEHISEMSALAVKRSLDHARLGVEEFRHEVEKKVERLFTHRPVIEVKINDGKPVNVKGRVSPALPRLIVNARLGVFTMMVGPAGCGKTTAAFQLAEALGLQFGSVCLTAGASETWLFGRQTPTGFVEGVFAKIYREGGVFLADEMDAADANLLLSINTALSHDSMLNPMNGEFVKRHPDFVFVGAANTNGKGSTHLYTGRSRLDAATLDRMVIVTVDYDEALERDLCPNEVLRSFLTDTRAGLRKEGYDEFVSTRAFQFTWRQFEAGVSPKEIKDSLVANWGDAAKNVAERHFQNTLGRLPSKEGSYHGIKEQLKNGEIPGGIPKWK